MKKLMMTTVAALGFAALAQAEVLNSTGFEDYVKNNNDFAVNTSDSGSPDSGTQYWTGTGDFSQTVLKTYGEDVVKPTNLPDDFETAGDYFLSVDTGNDVMYRKAGAEAGSVDLNQGAVFFDANVKFTASETDVEASDGDKLLVWLKGDDTKTNLVVTAGLYNALTGEYDPTNFTVDAVDGDYAADTWYRLTVKAAVDDNKLTYFNVYIDGEPVKATDKTTDFYSLVQTGVNKYVIAEAGFQGTGALDNVVWTTTDPFPPVEVDEFTASVTLEQVRLAGNENDIVDAWALEGEDKTGTYAATATVAVGDDAKFVVRMVSAWDVTVTATINGVQVDQANIVKTDGEGDEEGSSVYTITIDGSKYGDGDTAALVITITENEGGDEPEDTTEINANGTGYVADEDGTTYTKAAVEAMVTVVAPNADSLSNEAKAAYNAYFTKTATYNADTHKWEVTAALNETALKADVKVAVEEALAAVDAGATSVALPAGFYYKVESGSALPIATTATDVSTGAKIEVKGLTKAAGFFKVSVGTTEFAE